MEGPFLNTPESAAGATAPRSSRVERENKREGKKSEGCAHHRARALPTPWSAAVPAAAGVVARTLRRLPLDDTLVRSSAAFSLQCLRFEDALPTADLPEIYITMGLLCAPFLRRSSGTGTAARAATHRRSCNPLYRTAAVSRQGRGARQLRSTAAHCSASVYIEQITAPRIKAHVRVTAKPVAYVERVLGPNCRLTARSDTSPAPW